jgi:hypothetical protein
LNLPLAATGTSSVTQYAVMQRGEKRSKKKADQAEMKEFIEKECSDWSKYK